MGTKWNDTYHDDRHPHIQEDSSGIELFRTSYLDDNNKGCCKRFFDVGRELENVNTSHRYTEKEKDTLQSYESFEYLPADNKNYRKWAQKYFKKYEYDRWFLNGLIGLVVGIIGFLLKQIIDSISYLRIHNVSQYLQNDRIFLAFIVLFLSGMLLVVISSSLTLWRPSAAGSGVPELIGFLNGTNISNIFNLKTGIVKFVSCLCAVSSGLPVGPEGPMIHLGALIGAGISQMHSKTIGITIPFFKRFRNSEDKRNFISAGAAAGVASAFRAPIGGLLFSMEEVSSFWSMSLMWQIFFCSMISTFTTDFLSSSFKRFNVRSSGGRFLLSEQMLFQIMNKVSMSILAFIPAIILGCICGFLGAVFTFINIKICRLRKNVHERIRSKLFSAILKVVEPCLILLFVCIIVVFLPMGFSCININCKKGFNMLCKTNETDYDDNIVSSKAVCHSSINSSYSDAAAILWSNGDDSIRMLFKKKDEIELRSKPILLLLPLYFILAVWAAGSSISSGLIVPLLFIGGLVGRLFGIGLGIMLNDPSIEWLNDGVWSLIGAAAFFAGVSRLTVSLTVIMLEVTNDVGMLLPIMFAVISSRCIANLLTHSLYHAILEMKCIPFLAEDPPASRMVEPRVEDIMSKPAIVLQDLASAKTIVEILKVTQHGTYPVVSNVDGMQRFVGTISRHDLKALMVKNSSYVEDVALLDEDNSISYEEMSNFTVNEGVLDAAFSVYENSDDYYIDLKPYMNNSAVSVLKTFSLHRSYIVMRTLGLQQLIVTDVFNCVKGVITRKDLMPFALDERLNNHVGNLVPCLQFQNYSQYNNT